MDRLDVTILGREYTLACAPSERESVIAAALHLDRAMQRLRNASKPGTSTERIAIMAALQLSAELLATPVAGGQESEVALGDYKRKIEDMEHAIDRVLAR